MNYLERPRIGVIDYGMGNLVSVCNAFRFLGANTHIINSFKHFDDVDGIVLPGVGAFGKAMENLRDLDLIRPLSDAVMDRRTPFLGICLGLQCAIIDFSRSVCEFKNANSTEFKSRIKYPVIDLMNKQKNIRNKGATMRLGSYPCKVKRGTKAYVAYRKNKIHERHRHRYEVNNKYIKKLENKGLVISGINEELNLVEMIEIKNHPWFVAVQFHPELKSRIDRAHPLFKDFIKAAIDYKHAKYKIKK